MVVISTRFYFQTSSGTVFGPIRLPVCLNIAHRRVTMVRSFTDNFSVLISHSVFSPFVSCYITINRALGF